MTQKNSLKQLAETVEKLNIRLTVLETANAKKYNGLDMHPEALWTPKHISKYSGLSYGYVRQFLIKRDNFPKALPIGDGAKRKRLFFLAGDVVQYFNHKPS